MLNIAKKEMPNISKNILDTLGESILNSIKSTLKNTKTPHARFERQSKVITKGKNKGKVKNYLKYKGTIQTNSIDTGLLRNSFSRGASGNVWTYQGKGAKLILHIGSSVKYAKYINDGYSTSKHWLPGTINSQGKFIYQAGAKTGINVRARTYKGIHFFEIAFEEVEKIVPDIIRHELQNIFKEM